MRIAAALGGPGRPLAAAALLLPTVALFAPKGATPLLALCATLALVAPGGRRMAALLSRDRFTWLLAALLLWALAAAFRSPAPIDAAGLWLRVAPLVLAAAVATQAAAVDPAPVLRMLPLGVVLGLALAALELAADHPIRALIEGERLDPRLYVSYWLGRGMTALALLVWPAAAALWRRSPRKALAVLAAGGLVVLAGPQVAAKLAFAAGLLAAALAWKFGRRLRPLFAAAAAAAVLGMPLLPALLPAPQTLLAEASRSSFGHRALIWSFAAERIAEKPLAGWGFDASRDVPGGQAAAPGTVGVLMPLHPHNGALQVWLELGVLGAALLASVVAAVVWWALGLAEAQARAAAFAAVSAALIVGCVSYGVWQTQWIAMLGLTACFVAAVGAGAAATRAPKAGIQPPCAA